MAKWSKGDGLDVGDYGYYYLRLRHIDKATFYKELPPEAQSALYVDKSRTYGWSAWVKIIVRITKVDLIEGKYGFYVVGCEPLLPKRTSKLLLKQDPHSLARSSKPSTAHSLGLATLNRDIDFAAVECPAFFLRFQEGEGRGRVSVPTGSSARVRFVSLLSGSQRALLRHLAADLEDIIASSFETRHLPLNQVKLYHRTSRGNKVTSPGHTALPGDYILYVDKRTKSHYRLRWACVDKSQPKIGKIFAEKLEVIPHLSSDSTRKDNFHKAVHDPSRNHPKSIEIEIAAADVRAIRARGYSHKGVITYDSKMSFGPGDRVFYSSQVTQGRRRIGWIIQRSGDYIKVWSPKRNKEWFDRQDDPRQMREDSHAIYIENVHTDGRVPAHVFSSPLSVSYPGTRGTKIYVILWGTLSGLLDPSPSTTHDSFPHIYEAWVAPAELWDKEKPSTGSFFSKSSSRYSLKAKPGAFKNYLVSFEDPANQKYGTRSGPQCMWFSRRNIFLSAAGAREHIEIWSKQTYRFGRRSTLPDPERPTVSSHWLAIHAYRNELRAPRSTGRTLSPAQQHRSHGSQGYHSGGGPTKQFDTTKPDHQPYSNRSSQIMPGGASRNSDRRYSKNSSVYGGSTGDPNRSHARDRRPTGYAAGNVGAASTRSSPSYTDGSRTDRSNTNRSNTNALSEGSSVSEKGSTTRSLRDLRTGDAHPRPVSIISRDASLDREHEWSSRQIERARHLSRTLQTGRRGGPPRGWNDPREGPPRRWNDTDVDEEYDDDENGLDDEEEAEETARDDRHDGFFDDGGEEGGGENVQDDEEVMAGCTCEQCEIRRAAAAEEEEEEEEVVVVEEEVRNSRGHSRSKG